MSKTAIILLSFFSSAALALPIKQGNWMLGGGFSYSETKNKSTAATYPGETAKSLYLSPSAEYFIVDNFSLGGTISHLTYKAGNYSSTSNHYGPSLTFYFLEMGNFVFNAGATHQISKYTSDTNTYSQTTFSFGNKYFFSPNAAFGVSVNYTTYGSDNSSDNQIALVGSFSIYL